MALRQLLIGCRGDSRAEAKQLSALQAEVVEVDATDAASLRSAFNGAYGVFALTVTLHGPPSAQEEYEAEVKLGAPQPRHAKLLSRSGRAPRQHQSSCGHAAPSLLGTVSASVAAGLFGTVHFDALAVFSCYLTKLICSSSPSRARSS